MKSKWHSWCQRQDISPTAEPCPDNLTNEWSGRSLGTAERPTSDSRQQTQDNGHGGTWRSWRDDKPQKAKRQSTNNSNNKGQKWTRQFRRHQQPPFQQSWKHRAPSTKHRAPITDRQDREVLQVLCRLPSPVSWCLCMNSIIWYQLVIVRCDWNVICKNAHILNVTHAGAPLAPHIIHPTIETSHPSNQPSSHPDTPWYLANGARAIRMPFSTQEGLILPGVSAFC